MQLKRRNVLFGLMGLSLPFVASSCAQSASQITANSSSGTPGSSDTTAASGSGQAPAKIRVGYQVYAGPDLLAKGLGLAKQTFANSEVQYVQFDAGRDVNTALAAKGIDFGVLGSVAASVGLSRNIPYDVFYIYDLTGTSEALVVKPDIKTVADIRGKRIAVPFSSTSHFSLLSLLKLEGISPNEVTVLDMVPPDMLAAWQRGDIDGGYLWQPGLSKMEQDGGRVLATSGDLAKRGYATFDVAVVRREFAQQYPEVVRQYVAMLDQAVKLYRQDPQAAAKAIAPELGLSPEESLSQIKQYTWFDAAEQTDSKYLGTTDKPGAVAKLLKDSADFMVAQKAIPSAPDLETVQKHIFY
ncbi:ABC transporter substrate-binding protein [Leptolyngbya sp. FACHB-261]|uniref:taurine ABC transporter substrate-binding protein n=1 Tax=Leptolyngbya sp. FACHB-261 TaxID=2692806 RepID=UPI00168483EA|nr:ABC transporter substrate-binding protein [Leptolyngbya sp. FACHB-261]MBD2100286.1 ABC transporter substrate-binding protein [Leptolyngbya sp. FACHB-261]